MAEKRRTKLLRKEYAAFRPDIVDFFVRKVLPRARTVLDPMAGTSPLIPYVERLGISACFNDILPVHFYVNRAKTFATCCQVRGIEANSPGSLRRELCHLMSKLENKSLIVSDKWIHDDVLEGLLEAWAGTRSYETQLRVFLQAVIMLCVREYSCVAPSEKNSTWNRPGGMTTEKPLNEVVQECIGRFLRYFDAHYAGAGIEGGDLRFSTEDVRSLETSTRFDTILTSPSYPNRCDYVIAHAPEIYFLSECEGTQSFEDLRSQVLGTNVVKDYEEYESHYQFIRQESPQTAGFLASVREKQRPGENGYYFRYFTRYYSTLYDLLDRLIALLAPGGSFYLVVQDNIHRGELNEVGKFASEYLLNQGLTVTEEEEKPRSHQGRRNISENHPLVIKKQREVVIRVTGCE